MKKAIIISCYWPPAKSAGAQRIFSFAKYLLDFGYETLVVTTCEGTSQEIAPSESTPRVRVKPVPYWFNPADWTRKHRKGGNPTARPGFLRRLTTGVQRFIWLNLFIPDAKIGWYRPARKALDRLLKEEAFDIVISSAPPYTTHLLGKYVKKRYGLPWIADMRDPWLESHVYNQGMRFRFIRHINARLEKGVLETADRVVCAMQSQKDLFCSKLCTSQTQKVSVITNGYDHSHTEVKLRQTRRFTLSYFGTSYADGYPLGIFDLLGTVLRRDADLRSDFLLRIVGETPPEIVSYIRNCLPSGCIDIRSHITHDRFSNLLYESQLLLLIINYGGLHQYSLPSKLFEYLPTGNPILGVGPTNHEAAHIMTETQRGTLFETSDRKGIEAFVLNRYQDWKQGRLSSRTSTFPQYERRTQACELAGLLNELTTGAGT